MHDASLIETFQPISSCSTFLFALKSSLGAVLHIVGPPLMTCSYLFTGLFHMEGFQSRSVSPTVSEVAVAILRTFCLRPRR